MDEKEANQTEKGQERLTAVDWGRNTKTGEKLSDKYKRKDELERDLVELNPTLTVKLAVNNMKSAHFKNASSTISMVKKKVDKLSYTTK